MTKAKYSDIRKKNEAVMKIQKYKSPSGKIKVAVMKNVAIVKTSKKRGMVNKAGLPVKITVRKGFVERKKRKQQAKHDLKTSYNKEVTEPLFTEAFELAINNKANGCNPFWTGLELYWAGYARGVREQHQKQREKESNIERLTGDDIADLAQTLHIDINKLNTAVLELTASKGGRQ